MYKDSQIPSGNGHMKAKLARDTREMIGMVGEEFHEALLFLRCGV